jgi:hypothetical protein
VINMSLVKLWFIHNPVLVSYSICMRQGSSDLSGSQSALTCLCVCARAQLGLREFNNGQTMESTHTAFLDIPELSKAVSVAHIFQPWKTTHCFQWANYMMKVILYYSVLVKSQLWIQNKKNPFERESGFKHWLMEHKIVQKKVQTKNVTAKQHNHISAANNGHSLRTTGSLVNYLHKDMFICTKSSLIHATSQ